VTCEQLVDKFTGLFAKDITKAAGQELDEKGKTIVVDGMKKEMLAACKKNASDLDNDPAGVKCIMAAESMPDLEKCKKSASFMDGWGLK
jgi:hypothetical protein